MCFKNNLRGFCIMACVVLAIFIAVLAPATAKTTITFGSWQFLNPNAERILLNFIKEFESKNPEIEIETMVVPFSSYNEKLTTQLRAGVGPDLMFLRELTLVPWAKAGYLQPLNDLVQYDLSKIAGQQSLARIDGKDYALMYTGFPYAGLIYNKALFEKAGLTVPKTPDELIEVAQKLTTSDQWGLIHPTNFGNLSYIMQGGMIVINGFGGSIYKGKIGEMAKPAVTDSGFVEGLKYLKRIYDSGAVPKGLDFRQQRQLFIQGKAAMVLDGVYWPFIVKSQNPAVSEQLGVAPLPFPDPATPWEMNFYAINANSKHLEETAKLLEFLMQPETQATWASEQGTFTSGLDSVNMMGSKYPWTKIYADAIPYSIIGVIPGFESKTPEIRNVVAEFITEAMSGKSSPEEVANNLQTELLKMMK